MNPPPSSTGNTAWPGDPSPTGPTSAARCEIRCTINSQPHRMQVEARHTVVDVLRDQLGLTGTHAGCEHGVCGACTVLMDGEPVRSCLMFGPQLDGRTVTTVEGLAPAGGDLHRLQESFTAHGALQCGFCTPGMLLTALDFLEHDPTPSREDIRRALSANLCRCTGYGQIIDAVMDAARGGTFDCT